MTTTEQDAAEAGAALMRARADVAAAVERAKRAAVEYVHAGGRETDAARLVGLDRMTVRKALGK